VSLPPRIDRVVTISDGFIEGVMTVFGVQKRLVGVGSSCLTQKDYRFSFPLKGGQSRDYAQGMHTVRLLNPWIADLPLIAVWNSAPNYEKIAGLDPDLVIIRVGS
jgi:iron complex transport system substrate-binding protein